MLIKEISKTAEKVGLDNVDPVGITEISESHSQPLSNEELFDLAQQLSEQLKEDEDEDRETKAMQTKDLLNSAIVMAAEKLCDTNYEWERNSTVKGAHPYYEILQEKEKNRNN